MELFTFLQNSAELSDFIEELGLELVGANS